MIAIAMGTFIMMFSRTCYYSQSLPEGLYYTGMTCEYVHAFESLIHVYTCIYKSCT